MDHPLVSQATLATAERICKYRPSRFWLFVELTSSTAASVRADGIVDLGTARDVDGLVASAEAEAILGVGGVVGIELQHERPAAGMLLLPVGGTLRPVTTKSNPTAIEATPRSRHTRRPLPRTAVDNHPDRGLMHQQRNPGPGPRT